MAVSIDSVYQKVLATASKEQRGYITPQEFNLFADQAQKKIFEQYFYDINQFNRVPGNSTEFSDMLHILEEKLAPFRINGHEITDPSFVLPTDLYRLGEVYLTKLDDTYPNYVVEVNANEITKYNLSALTRPTKENPVYVRSSTGSITIYPSPLATDVIECNYTSKPTTPKWGYVVVQSKALYNANSSTNFQLHESEEVSLVNEILTIAGIAIRQPDVTVAAEKEEIKKVQQEKQ